MSQPWLQAHFLSQRAARCVIEGVTPALPRLPFRRLLQEFVFQNALFSERGRIHSTRLIAAPSFAKQHLSLWDAPQQKNPCCYYKKKFSLSLIIHDSTVKEAVMVLKLWQKDHQIWTNKQSGLCLCSKINKIWKLSREICDFMLTQFPQNDVTFLGTGVFSAELLMIMLITSPHSTHLNRTFPCGSAGGLIKYDITFNTSLKK